MELTDGRPPTPVGMSDTDWVQHLQEQGWTPERKQMATAWGWLWHVTTGDERVKSARRLLGNMLPRELKRYGIETAKAEGAQVNEREIEAAMLRGL